MIGFFIVESFGGDTDAAGFNTQIKASNKMDMNIKNILFLPPYLRKSQCNINIGDTVFGIVDDVTGLGFAVFGAGEADFQYFFDADVTIKQKLTVKKDIESIDGDVIADDISLQDHVHKITLVPGDDALAIFTSGAGGGQSPATLSKTETNSASMPIIPIP